MSELYRALMQKERKMSPTSPRLRKRITNSKVGSSPLGLKRVFHKVTDSLVFAFLENVFINSDGAQTAAAPPQSHQPVTAMTKPNPEPVAMETPHTTGQFTCGLYNAFFCL